jgi:hypothetical protein
VVVVAVPVIAWLAVSYDNARRANHASIVLAEPQPSRAEIDAALRDVRAAHHLADPTDSLAYQAALEIRAGRLGAARALYEQIVRREPDTADAWVVLSELSRTGDPALSAHAAAQVRRLDPLRSARH